MTERLAGRSRRAGTVIVYFPRGFLLTVVKEFVENLNKIFFLSFLKKSFHSQMIGCLLKQWKCAFKGEQPTLAKLKIIIMGHTGLAG